MTTPTDTLTARAHAAYAAHVAADLAQRARNDALDRQDTTAMLHDILMGQLHIDAPLDAITWHGGRGAYANYRTDGLEFALPLDGHTDQLSWRLVCGACGGLSDASGALGPDGASTAMARLGGWLNAAAPDRCGDCREPIDSRAVRR